MGLIDLQQQNPELFRLWEQLVLPSHSFPRELFHHYQKSQHRNQLLSLDEFLRAVTQASETVR